MKLTGIQQHADILHISQNSSLTENILSDKMNNVN